MYRALLFVIVQVFIYNVELKSVLLSEVNQFTALVCFFSVLCSHLNFESCSCQWN